MSGSSTTFAWSMAVSACSILTASLSSSAYYRTWALLLSTFALHFLLLWGPATPQGTAGFLSIDCGGSSNASFSQDISWVSDSNFIQEGTPLPAIGASERQWSTLRLFDGDKSKYCYSLTSSAVKEGAFFLLRASFWTGFTPSFPRPSDNYLNFTMIVDGDVWAEDVAIPYESSTGTTAEIYMRAQRNTIDVCLARSSPHGDAPFINALELRPLPSTLTSTKFMSQHNHIMVLRARLDIGVPVLNSIRFRYPEDPLDRIWTGLTKEYFFGVNNASTEVTIDTSRQEEKPPPQIFQTAITAESHQLSISISEPDPKSVFYFVEFYFAEIDPRVNASGLRVFKIDANGVPLRSVNGNDPQGNIDVFARVGANAALGYAYTIPAGSMTLTLSATPESIYPPYLAAAEFFATKTSSMSLSSSSTVRAVEEIKTSLSLASYKGDPCLPTGFQYNWLKCSGVHITNLSLSNYHTKGTISHAINNLTSLTEIHMDGNNLHGGIPDLSALTNLQVLDLSNNGLTGSIPGFLATLKNLKILNVQNNNLSGEVPAALLQQKQDRTLIFEFSGNSLLCSESNVGVSICNSRTTSSAFNKKKSNSVVIIGASVAGIMVVSLGIGIGIVVYCMCGRNKHKPSKQQELAKRRQNSVTIQKSLYEFTFEDIKYATSNFSTQIGKGGFGPVYKGILEDGHLVAIKGPSNASSQGSKEFVNEVDMLSRIHHKNLVSFLGYCDEENMALVYEFMSNGSLYDHLHGPYVSASPLSWTTRLGIIVDAAQGLDYLHYGCNPRIVHRDIKSSNILLNEHLQAKISDFGISRNTMMDKSDAVLTDLIGSAGYMDPEYAVSFNLTEKVDVYSFGVLLFEIVCGQKPIFNNSFQQQVSIVEWAQSFIERGIIHDIVDASLHGKYDTLSVWKVLEVAMECVQFSSLQRPSMSVVFQELKEAQRMNLERINNLDTSLMDRTSGSNPNTFHNAHVSVR